MIKYITTFVILTVLGILYERYKLKYQPDEELSKYDLIKKYLLNGSDNLGGKPILWIHATHNLNARNWASFYSRNNTKLNQPYLLSCLETIVKYCGTSFNICLIDDNSFTQLIPDWDISVRKLARPLRTHIRSLAMAKLLYAYGGLTIPNSTIVIKDLMPLYDRGMDNTGCMVGETLPRSDVAAYTTMFPNHKFLGCIKECPTMKEYISYLEILNSHDYTNEMDFCGDIDRYLYKLTQLGKMNKLSGCILGAKDTDDNDVTLERLMGTTYVDFDPKIYAIYLPQEDILSRTKYGWFSRQSQAQLKKCPTVATKWLLIAQEQ